MHAFVDETKRNGLLLVATLCDTGSVDVARKTLQGMLLKSQRRIHFNCESDTRRRQICATLRQLPVQAMVYDATRIARDAEARRLSLARLVGDLASRGGTRLVIEQDDGLVPSDKRILFSAVRQHGVADTLEYHHMKPYGEPLLWVSDAVAWCTAKGGNWGKEVSPLVVSTVRVRP